ncbi:MAG: hypothetical protein AUF79_10390 [Crenarchaeota archaeon 13_1_20CM_2_51_8]|nr:MAG: hypothetical protein AUF79_10390 [Crenarchaeota archaeon 13_1_20CM_2_51_8]
MRADTNKEFPDSLVATGGQEVAVLEKQTVPVRTAWTETLSGRAVINDTIMHVITVDATAFLRGLIKFARQRSFHINLSVDTAQEKPS